LGDEPHQRAFTYEAGGYPSTPTGIPEEVFETGRLVGRVRLNKPKKDGDPVEQMSIQSVELWEQRIAANKIALHSASDPSVSVTSANPSQFVMGPVSNRPERKRLSDDIARDRDHLARSRAHAYNYTSAALYQLRFSETAQNIFDEARRKLDLQLITLAPGASKKVSSIQDNLRSENSEDWANAVHSCRRLLQEVADVIYPARAPEERNGRTVKLGPDNYINWLVCYIDDKSDSERYKALIGSNLSHIGERLDAVFRAAQKGSHSDIASRDEAERYVIFTFLLLSDVTSL
jgi:hypothetical protein